MAQTLEMVFKTGQGRTYRITLDDPRPDLTPAEVKAFMDLVLSVNPFDIEGGLVEIAEANIIDTEVQPLQLI
ncbi:hypothetical protein JOD02_001473 [Caldicoprobacter guelmensis]|uniref:DUF2922 domain-containing protein n=1 Tax=Caldicoprobacter guelmensis TaxID=1170224 RepID=UPI00311C947E|nr:hypothetical protein [Caldicoprobacter guelmensis]